jgi:sigma-B regulation protein RsbU (phosphoserine phosphatase)
MSSQPPVDHLSLLLRLTQTFNSSLNLSEVLDRVMDEVIQALHAERGFVMLCEDDGRLAFRTARGLDQQGIEAPQFQISRSVVESVARDGLPLLTNDALTDERFSGRQSVMMLGLRSILCAPLKVKDRVTGVLYVDNRLQAGLFTHADLELLTAIAGSAAIAIENARLYLVAVEKGRMDRELEMARKVQTGLIPGGVPQLPGWDFAARWLPAHEVAGDYYDFIPCGLGRPGLVIADVTDKGMAAALFMAFARSIVRANVCDAPSPSDGLARANRLICADSSKGLFITMFYGLLNSSMGILEYVNAGHNPPLFYQAGQNQLTLLKATGMPLGVEPDTKFGQRSIQLEPGDFILLYTDGVTEAFNAHEMEFGIERLQEAVLGLREASAEGILEGVVEAVKQCTNSAAPSDDITIMVVKRLLAT